MFSVLIVDDSKLIRQTLAAQFSKNNFFELLFASSYQETQELIASKKYIFAAIVGMILSDAPNGEVVDMVLLHKIPTIVLTSNISDDIIRTYSQKPIIDYVPKTSIHDILYTVEMVEVLFYFQGRKALIVDDNQTFLYFLSIMFQNLQFEVVTAKSGQEALDILEKDKSIQIVTIDYNMPGMNGIELIQKINVKYYKRGLSLLAVTSESDMEVTSKFIKSGADDLLSKPITKESFNARIFKVLTLKKKLLEVDSYLKTMEKYVLSSTTDERGYIRGASKSFIELSGYSAEELIGKPHNVVRHPEMPSETFADLWKTLLSGKGWEGEIKNLKKDGGFYWVHAHVNPLFNNNGKVIGYQSIRQDITDKKEVEEKSKQLEIAKKKITDSIEFASLIQSDTLPLSEDIAQFYDDHFIYWEPKDIVGGDTYHFATEDSKSLLFMIDCTGHGVPGAFMTMMVKTVLDNLLNEENFDNPAKILSLLSQTIQSLLKQDLADSKSDAGLDGGIFFYDKKENFVRYAGAKTPLFYVVGGELKVFSGDRESIGYKKSNIHHQFKNFEMKIEDPSYFYITTDGYIDQNGGKSGYPYGKKGFKQTIIDSYNKPFKEQEEIFLEALRVYQQDFERDDDITFCGLLLSQQSVDNFDEKVIFTEDFTNYSSDTMLRLENIILDAIPDKHYLRPKREKILTILYEMGQNLMKYGVNDKSSQNDGQWDCKLSGGIKEEEFFYIVSSNIITKKQKEVILSRLAIIDTLEKDEIKVYYKELRKSGKYKHKDGAGLGFLELAKRASKPLDVAFKSMDGMHEYYTLKVYI